MSKRLIAVAAAVAALAAPAAAVAGPGQDKGKTKQEKVAKQERKAAKALKPVMFVFKGVYEGNGVVAVQKGNKHVRRAGFVGTDVTFDLTGAKVVAAELVAGDVVVVQARLPRGTKAPEAAVEGAEAVAPVAIKARKVIDKTHPPVADGEDEEKAAGA